MAIPHSAYSFTHHAQFAPNAGSGGNDGWWGLMYQGWVLVMPNGKHLNLTTIERACFLCLLASPQRELAREALAQALPQSNLRTINVSISRLRKKVRDMGITLPLHTVHGMGYVFLGHLIAEAGASEAKYSAQYSKNA
ncbi:winged helix-turn-helix domain-containing protein [Bordetella sp. BOR01]|uniref:winged helix-turn-helix domain-containing protein n=1 Tax=Bordetella sp. BOR01 TaxID=2854779 RepID=UPI001C444EAD|nr:winged helix-turn-helix domain-containing protein [Bordetella sp. BOR01]MBV7486918.1 winged helix-turn-helix domain-containing protein [Bordetella sp. BOR01]